MDLGVPKVMGILNVTPDSFYPSSRTFEEDKIREKVAKLIEEGADIIDIGGCSTRPGYQIPSLEEELRRIDIGCRLVKEINENIPISIDTFRPEVASMAIDIWKADIINDISGGDESMFEIIAKNHVIYILTHNPGEENKNDYKDVTAETITWLSWKLHELHKLGVNDVIIDPGFGFSKNTEENYRLFNEIDEIKSMGFPLLVGISRKSMIYKILGTNPEESLTGTIALNAIALEKGVDILRVHDVKEAKETVMIFQQLKGSRT